jgi:hypothetical protein
MLACKRAAENCSRKQMHKIVEYPFRADKTQQITISLQLISLQIPHLKSLYLGSFRFATSFLRRPCEALSMSPA